MEISKYVAELIQFHKEVGVDGLGTIYRKKSPGRYDTESRAFLPPGSVTAFKKEVTESSLLIDHLIKQEHISREVAADAVSRLSIQITQQLAESGVASFEPIGILKASNGNIILEQNADFKPGTEFFGLPKVTKPVAEETVTVIPVTPIIPVTIPVTIPVQEAPATPVERAQPVAIEPIKLDVTEPVKPEEVAREEEIITDNLLEEENPGKETHEPIVTEIKRPFTENTIKYTIQEDKPAQSGSVVTKVALILLGILLLSVAFYFLYPRISSSFTEEPTVPAASADKQRADSIKRVEAEQAMLDSAFKADSIKIAQGKAAIPAAADTLKEAPPVVSTAVTYEVIGASVLNQKEANWFIETMRKNGIKAKVVHNIPGKRLKLSIATLTDEKTAKTVRDRLAEKLKIKGLYIYKNKPE